MRKSLALIGILAGASMASPSHAVGVFQDGTGGGVLRFGGLGATGSPVMIANSSYIDYDGAFGYEESGGFLFWLSGNQLEMQTISPDGDTAIAAWVNAPNYDGQQHSVQVIINTASAPGYLIFYIDNQEVAQSDTNYQITNSHPYTPNLVDGSTWHAAGSGGGGFVGGFSIQTANDPHPVYLSGPLLGGWDNTNFGNGGWDPWGGDITFTDVILSNPSCGCD